MNTVEIPESEAAHWGRQPQPPPDSVRSSWDPRQKKEWKARGSTEKERRRGLAFLPHPDSSSAHHLRNLPARDSWHPLLPPTKRGEAPSPLPTPPARERPRAQCRRQICSRTKERLPIRTRSREQGGTPLRGFGNTFLLPLSDRTGV